ncbi:hypothetical protein [Shewanella frigidimarina]|uniref:hypothetical protein n=1 Tax=Shewanella frigidimarina TaxID=56812 RepID=UPI000F4F9CC5|nr:hypothetical protein [Shewanella frigidimarina]RPA32611.1 hypothetical protein EGC78_08285 [Shewanella frigidimarina]
MYKIKIKTFKPNFDYQAIVSVDADPLAERCFLIDRTTLDVIGSKPVTTEIIKFRVPLKNANKSSVMVIIVDDDDTYNAAIIDGVQAEIIDANLVKI